MKKIFRVLIVLLVFLNVLAFQESFARSKRRRSSGRSSKSSKSSKDKKKRVVDPDKYLDKWIQALNRNLVQDAKVEIKVNKLDEQLKGKIPPGFPMPTANIYWKFPDKVLYKLLLPKVDPQMELLLQSSGLDEELKKIAKQANFESIIRNVMKKALTKEEIEKILKFRDKKGKESRKLEVHKLKKGYDFLVIDKKAKSYKDNGYKLTIDKKFRLTKIYKYKKGVCYEKGTVKWDLVKGGDKEFYFPKHIKYHKLNKKNVMVFYDIELKNAKLNSGLKDELFKRED